MTADIAKGIIGMLALLFLCIVLTIALASLESEDDRPE